MPSPITDSESTPAALPRRRWLQYSLRSLFVLTAICAFMAYQAGKWWRDMVEEEQIIAALRAQKIIVGLYGENQPNDESPNRPPDSFRRLVGKDDFHNACVVQFVALYKNYEWAEENELRKNPDWQPELVWTNETDDNIRMVARLRSLQSLSLSGPFTTNESIARLSTLDHLLSLTIAARSVDENGLRCLVSMTKLISLTLNMEISHDAMAVVGKLVSLRDFTAGMSCIDDEDLREIGKLVNLKYLDLEHTRVTDAGIVHLRSMSKLHTLVLGGTAVTGKGFSSLKDLPLKSIELWHSKFNDDGIEELLQIRSLENIQLENSLVTFHPACRLLALPNIKTLDVNLTECELEEFKELKAKHPDVTLYNNSIPKPCEK